MAWVYLIIAGLLEVAWAYALKRSDGLTRLGPTVAMIVPLVASFGFLALALRGLPLGTAYTVWTGIGALGTLAAGIMLLGEPVGSLRMAAAALIVSGLVLMKLSDAG